MTRPAADRVKAVWTGTGTGTMTLGGAAPGEPVQAFPAALNGQPVRYLIKHETAAEAEAGYGIYTHAGTTLSRLYRTYPSLGGSAVSFSAGTKFVSITSIHLDLVTEIAATDPTITSDINNGYLQGHEWINTVSDAVFKCVDHSAGAAVWPQTSPRLIDQWDILARIVAGTGNAVGIGSADLTAEATPASGDLLLGWLPTGELRTFDVGTLPTGTGDVAPSQVSSNAAEYVLTTASRLHTNTEIRSHQANVDFEVPTTAPAGSKWLIKFLHDGCTVSVDTNVGSINGVAAAAARGINGGLAIIEVESNAGSAPVVLVRGDVLVAPTDVGGAKSYDNDDTGQDFRLTTTTTQTFTASANYLGGFYVNIFKEVAGNVTLDGVDADYTLQPPDAVTVWKIGTALMASGKAGVTVLDAA